jgi:hypothetical protein
MMFSPVQMRTIARAFVVNLAFCLIISADAAFVNTNQRGFNFQKANTLALTFRTAPACAYAVPQSCIDEHVAAIERRAAAAADLSIVPDLNATDPEFSSMRQDVIRSAFYGGMRAIDTDSG